MHARTAPNDFPVGLTPQPPISLSETSKSLQLHFMMLRTSGNVKNLLRPLFKTLEPPNYWNSSGEVVLLTSISYLGAQHHHWKPLWATPPNHVQRCWSHIQDSQEFTRRIFGMFRFSFFNIFKIDEFQQLWFGSSYSKKGLHLLVNPLEYLGVSKDK